MAKVLTDDSNYTAIANAIRTKKGVETTYLPSEMATAIGSIEAANLDILSVNANGTYTPTSPKNGFSEVTVAVPNTYDAGDEGKVVSNGELVAQSSQTVTQNGIYDTTLKNEIVVNVQSGGSQEGTQINFTNGTLSLSSRKGVDLLTYNVDSDGTVSATFEEYSAVFEFFSIGLGSLSNAKYYLLEFDYETTDGLFFPVGTWNLGFGISKDILNYISSSNVALSYPDNIVRDSIKRHYKQYFTPSPPTSSSAQPTGNRNMYVNFNVWGYSDEYRNKFSITNMKLFEL